MDRAESRVWKLIPILLAILLSPVSGQGWAKQTAAGTASAAAAVQVGAGRQIYFNGLLPSGQPVQATVTGDVPVSGDQLACVSCHRRSRLGTSEAGRQVAPVTAAALFGPGQNSRVKGALPEAFKQIAGQRPPYSETTLAKAIREGVNTAGRPLAPSMPRYALSDPEMNSLIAFLKTEPSSPTAGVSDTALHFATVVTPGVDPAERQRMVEMFQAFFHDKNAMTRHETKRQQFSDYKMYQVYRQWQLHVWELKGPAKDWPEQLEKYFRTQPVLAMVGGLSAGTWQPIHQFCEKFEVACLFPNTDVPVLSDEDFYSVYFSRGLTLEAQALARFFHEHPEQAGDGHIVQVFREGDEGATAAAAFRTKAGEAKLEDIALRPDQPASADLLRTALDRAGTGALILWLKQTDLGALEHIGDRASGPAALFLSASLTREHTPTLPPSLNGKLYLTYPWELPEARQTRSLRAQTWLKSKQIPLTHPRLQIDTFFTATLLGEIIKNILDNFSSTYMIERLEDMVTSLPPSTFYPRLSLGANQRFASKGCYIAKVSPDGKLTAASGWIIP